MNIPNLLSALRIILIPLFLYLIFIPRADMRIWALVVFAAASLTDIFDGWSARKLGQETDFGKFFDPIADKFLVISALIALLILDPLIPLWMILVIVFRDVLITFMRYIAVKKNMTLKTTRFGKIKTAFQMISIIVIIMVLIVRSSIGGVSGYVDDSSLIKFGTVYDIIMSKETNKLLIVGPYCLMAVVTLLTTLSGLRYLLTNIKLFSSSPENKEDRI